MVDTHNVTGHRQRLEDLLKTRPRQEALEAYVGGGARHSIGHRELEAIARFSELEGSYVVDVGCGIGRLAEAASHYPIGRYLGTDILPEVLEVAREDLGHDSRFAFKQVDGLAVPEGDASADIVCGFSLITHLLDEEVFCVIAEAGRVLKAGGVAVFSYLDFAVPKHRERFIRTALVEAPAGRKDVLKFFEKPTLAMFGEEAGLDVIEFQDAYHAVPAKFAGHVLPNGQVTGDELVMGQSIAYFRKRGD